MKSYSFILLQANGSIPFYTTLILTIFVLIVVWLILRELVCWYYKINERISLQKRTNELLEQLLNKKENFTNSTGLLTADTHVSNRAEADLKIYSNGSSENGLMCSSSDLSVGCLWAEANRLCANYNEDGFSGWRLPNSEELLLIYEKLHKNKVGNFKDKNYWSRDKFGLYDALAVNFSNGKKNTDPVSTTLNCVRAIRNF